MTSEKISERHQKLDFMNAKAVETYVNMLGEKINEQDEHISRLEGIVLTNDGLVRALQEQLGHLIAYVRGNGPTG